MLHVNHPFTDEASKTDTVKPGVALTMLDVMLSVHRALMTTSGAGIE